MTKKRVLVLGHLASALTDASDSITGREGFGIVLMVGDDRAGDLWTIWFEPINNFWSGWKIQPEGQRSRNVPNPALDDISFVASIIADLCYPE